MSIGLERGRVVESDEVARPALGAPELVEDAVLRDLEEPRREARAQREAPQPLEDAQEDVLGEVLGEGALADHPQHVVEDRALVGPDDERERALVPCLRLPKYPWIRLCQRHDRDEYIPVLGDYHSAEPVICTGFVKPSKASADGIRSRNSPVLSS